MKISHYITKREAILAIKALLLMVLIVTCLPSDKAYSFFEAEEKKLVSTRPALYLDCQQCDYNYIRQEISFVTYVRDPESSDIHLFITVQWIGNGGREYELHFIGRRQFEDINFSFTHSIDRNMTNAEIRDSLNEAIMMGLAPYMMRTSLAGNFRIQFEQLREDQYYVNDVHDPWRNWIFEVYAGRMQLSMESNQRDFQARWGFFADKVAHDWKLRFRPHFNYSFTEIDQEDEKSAISHNHRHGIDSYAIKSLGNHWSAGLFVNYSTRNDRNAKHNFRIQPGVEFSLFPYDMATRQSITFRYRFGYTYADYYDITIFDKTHEHLLNHRLEARARYQKPWGSINIGVIGSHYFHDATLRRLQTYSRFSIRITEGLSLSFQTDFDIVQDQLSLRAGELNLEDILMAQQELATDFSLRGMIAISYTFGSDFANIVNTRF